jgi:hypothetical protein
LPLVQKPLRHMSAAEHVAPSGPFIVHVPPVAQYESASQSASFVQPTQIIPVPQFPLRH